jgi:23S rRNA pseudouridine2605 synthase
VSEKSKRDYDGKGMPNRRNSKQKGRVSLERALSKLGLCSRTEARGWIEAGRVKVHGSVERDPSRQVNPDTAHVEVDGTKAVREEGRLILLHKPTGVLTTKRDPEGRPTIYSLLPPELHSLHPVGRLDLHTSGLLLLTNLTRLSSFLTDPVNAIPRIYIVGVEGRVLEEALRNMEAGIEDDGEILKARSAALLKSSGTESLLRLELVEGKNREVRRLCAGMGHEVRSLKRVSFGSFELGDLTPGSWREEDPGKVNGFS